MEDGKGLVDKNQGNKPDSLDKILQQAISRVPWVKYASGILGIAAAGAIIKLFLDLRTAAILIVAMLVVMAVLEILARGGKYERLKLIFLRFALTMTMLSTVVIVVVAFMPLYTRGPSTLQHSPSASPEGSTHPLVLIGSSNVRTYLWEKQPNIQERMNPLLIDNLGSNRALDVAFQAFRYGVLTNLGDKRVGLVALSSNGIVSLADKVESQKDHRDRIKNNFWLNIRVTSQPIMIFYRGLAEKALAVTITDKLPPEGGSGTGQAARPYRFIRFSALRDFINAGSADKIRRYLPEENMGTRSALEALEGSSSPKIDWNKAERIEERSTYSALYLEDLTGEFPFVAIMSAPPLSRDKELEKPATCQQLAERKIKAAAICLPKDRCEDLAWTDFSVVIKLNEVPGQDLEYKISNTAECDIAQQLTKAMSTKVTASCLVSGVHADEHHIVHILEKREFPEFLTCQ